MKRLLPALTGLILLVACTLPTTLSQVTNDVTAIVHGAELALPAFAPFLSPAELKQVNRDLSSADSLIAKIPADDLGKATNVQGILNLVEGVANVIAADLPKSPPAGVANAIKIFQAVMKLAELDAPILAPFVGMKAGATPTPEVFRSGMTAGEARARLPK